MPDENELRAALAVLADRAPDAEGVLTRLRRMPTRHSHRRWVAMAAVAAVAAAVAAVVIAAPLFRSAERPALPVAGPPTSPSAVHPVRASGPQISPATSQPDAPLATADPAPSSISTVRTGNLQPTEPSASTVSTGSVRQLPKVAVSADFSAGQTVGPLFTPTLTFAGAVADRSSAAQHLRVSVGGIPQAGAWVWSSESGTVSARFRATNLSDLALGWNNGKTVTVSADLAGIELSPGHQGSDFSRTLSIQTREVRAQVDVAAHTLTVVQGRETTGVFSVQIGAGSDDILTNGTHVVTEKYLRQTVADLNHLTPTTDAVSVIRWSDSGGFVQASSGTAPGPGRITLDPTDAEKYFDLVAVGDPVVVLNGAKDIEAGDGDWSYSNAQWIALAAASQK